MHSQALYSKLVTSRPTFYAGQSGREIFVDWEAAVLLADVHATFAERWEEFEAVLLAKAVVQSFIDSDYCCGRPCIRVYHVTEALRLALDAGTEDVVEHAVSLCIAHDIMFDGVRRAAANAARDNYTRGRTLVGSEELRQASQALVAAHKKREIMKHGGWKGRFVGGEYKTIPVN